ncbi:PREDICTED: FERM domain-containing protein 6-like, partial [Priapulus caudatus]|uniref:FERM domain-containing protein 6-like n=1 Tax=Priapulus caudatus TaxID=37621 RepID=A0ABM1EVB4_PRICU
MHGDNYGMDQDHAEENFLNDVKLLSEYGVHFYKLYTDKKARGQHVWLGVHARGIEICEALGDDRVPMQAFPWLDVVKVQFDKRSFL